MKRLLLSLLCCSPLVFFPATSISLDITGPANEQSLVYDQYGPVSPNETLWAISTKLRPDNSVSIQQTLVAIYKLNPYVFYEGNINKIIPQSVINIPPFEFVAQQTDTEAMALINKYSKNRKKQTAKTPKPPAKVKETVQDKPPVVKQEAAKEQVIVGDAEVIIDDAEVVKAAQLAFDKEKLAASELELQKLQEELLLVSEQLLVTTEENQILKLKLQPLEDTISELQIQMEDEALIQKKLQKIIDDYRAELDAVVEPPFSGEGMVNELLRAVTSSLLNLAIVILAPILVLLALFLVITRVRSKRLLAAQEQEMAESTAILMEESGQFDSLLTDEFGAEAEPDLDFSNDEHVPVPDTADLEQVELDDEIQEIDLSDDSDDSFAVDLTSSDVVDLTASDEVEASEDDPFGIGALSEEELISSVDLDEPEVEHNEDDPFGIGALVDEEDLISGVDLVDTDTISPEEQADLDLAAQWESQLSEESEETDVKQNDAVEQDESEFDLTAASGFNEQASEQSESPAEIDSSKSAIADPVNDDFVDDIAELDLEALAELESSESVESLSEQPELEIEQPEETAELSLEVLAELESSESVESLSEQPKLETEPSEETAELDLEALAELESSESVESLSEQPELETEQPEETAEL
ncbi:FimV/HubP family polar landmark protein, partial [Psychromonas ossibalaenae]|uniref:FimV/HubP family polar landmark protein n=1 Tax=Psychromonas ossibalaenae TaxID=444922 RepID=UPI00035CB593